MLPHSHLTILQVLLESANLKETEREMGKAPSDLTLADAGRGVAAGGAGALLQVEGAAAAAHAQRVRLVPALAEAAGTLPLRATATTTTAARRSNTLATEGGGEGGGLEEEEAAAAARTDHSFVAPLGLDAEARGLVGGQWRRRRGEGEA